MASFRRSAQQQTRAREIAAPSNRPVRSHQVSSKVAAQDDATVCGLSLLVAGQAQAAARVRLRRNWLVRVGIVHVVARPALDAAAIELDVVLRLPAPAAHRIGRRVEVRVLGGRRVGHRNRVVVAEVGAEHQRAPATGVVVEWQRSQFG